MPPLTLWLLECCSEGVTAADVRGSLTKRVLSRTSKNFMVDRRSIIVRWGLGRPFIRGGAFRHHDAFPVEVEIFGALRRRASLRSLGVLISET
jgi:hypothetical protein